MKMKNKTLMPFVWILFLAVFCIWSTHALGEFPSEPQSEKTIQPVLDAVTAATPRYLPVIFTTHDAHAKEFSIKCQTCHHDIKSESEKPKSCSSCHNKPDAKVDLTNAMHKSCRGCHLKYKSEDKDSTAPIDCLGCHTERK